MNTETYTIIQRTAVGSWATLHITTNLKQACDLCADYCNLAGVARTLVLDELGSVVCVES